MKKNLKRFLGAALAVSMMMGMASISAYAENTYDTENYEISVKETAAGHSYRAYQIFSGSLGTEAKQLINVAWGSGITDAGKTALGSATDLATQLSNNDLTGTQFAEMVRPYITGGTALAKGDTAYSTTVDEPGYYLIVDDAASLPTGENNVDLSASTFILEVLGDVEADPKSDVPSVIKKVMDKNDTTNETSGWQDSADYDIGDEVPFQLTATLPDNYSEYSKYTLVFHDVACDGLGYTAVTDLTINGTPYGLSNVNVSEGGNNLTFTLADLVSITNGEDLSGKTVVIEYTAVLDTDAVIGSAGNPNEVYLEYSNNPNFDVEHLGDKDDNGITETDNDGNSSGDDAYKDEDGNGKDDDTQDKGEDLTDEKGEKDTTGHTVKDKVKVFTYKVVINKVDADHEALAGAGFTLSKKAADGSYYEVPGTALSVNPEGTEFTFTGLDDGEYKLEETTVPGGYNKMADVLFTVSAEHDTTADDPTLTVLSGDVTSGEATFTAALADGSLTSDVINTSGIVLPSTGGMGTKVIYGAGGAMVLIAGVLLITKRRMGEDK